ncbi:MAG: tRNA (pseudouridine(54)-N(1))-methyltransferase TrmY [Halobacteriales archaeon]
MRQFVVVGHEAPTDADFPLDDLPGAGRLDVLCRCVNAAFVLSHDLRENVELHLLLGDELRIRLVGADLQYLSPDERNVASLLRSALEVRDEAVGAIEAESTPGIHVGKRDFESALADLDGPLVHLHPDGDPVAGMAPPADPAFVLSDHEPFAPGEAAYLADHADARVSLGPRRLHANHAITVAHNFLDTAGFEEY